MQFARAIHFSVPSLKQRNQKTFLPPTLRLPNCYASLRAKIRSRGLFRPRGPQNRLDPN
jgi:hypothetical protein